uniref:Uncharacterized protein n=1 Tax=Megaselia scalaris TaxID=36166 RepID=T1GPH8_MEGSC
MFKQLNSCGLGLRPVYRSNVQQECYECSSNLCNANSISPNNGSSSLSFGYLYIFVVGVLSKMFV